MKNNFSLENYVTIIKNNSDKFNPEEMINICKRENNSKRDFLFVNSFQGKHIHVSPSKIFELYDELAYEIARKIDKEEKVVIIGFAETATAIGQYIANILPNCIYHMQTTREFLERQTSIKFEEEHSHNTNQLIYGNIPNCDRIIFVDDEISTGNTVLNFITALKNAGMKTKYGVASILNWQDDKWTREFEEQSIDAYFIVRGKIKDINIKVSVLPAEQKRQGRVLNMPNIVNVESNITGFLTERIGNIPIDISNYSNLLYKEITDKTKNLPSSNESVLVLGTEEYMFAPMIFAKMLEEHLNAKVQFHATTRSPIVASTEGEYAIRSRHCLASCYDRNRKTFIYNLQKYDKVYIITDVIPNINFIRDITTHLVNADCNPENITIIIIKEGKV